MKFIKPIDRSRKGFARYCPTFAKFFSVKAEALQDPLALIRKLPPPKFRPPAPGTSPTDEMILGFLSVFPIADKQDKDEPPPHPQDSQQRKLVERLKKVVEDPEKQKIAVKRIIEALRNPDPLIRKGAAEVLGRANITQNVNQIAKPLAQSLLDPDLEVRLAASVAINRKENDISLRLVLPYLFSALDLQDHVHFRQMCDVLLETAAKKKYDISPAIPYLNAELVSAPLVRRSAADALKEAARHGANIEIAIPNLLQVLFEAGDHSKDVLGEHVQQSLEFFAQHGAPEPVLDKIDEFIRSQEIKSKPVDEKLIKGLKSAICLLSKLECPLKKMKPEQKQELFEAIAAPSIAALSLSAENKNARSSAIVCLLLLQRHGYDISAAVPALIRCLEDESDAVQWCAAELFEERAKKGTDISCAVHALAQTKHGNDALTAATKTSDLSGGVLPWATAVLENKDADKANNARGFLLCAAKSNPEGFLREIQKFLDSRKFLIEADLNSVNYQITLRELDVMIKFMQREAA